MGKAQNAVLDRLSKNKPAKYQRYDWESKTLAEWREITADGIIVVEGVYSTKKELADFYDFKIWVECQRGLRLKRGVERDGEAMREKWVNEWMKAEDKYVEEDNPKNRADLVVNGY